MDEQTVIEFVRALPGTDILQVRRTSFVYHDPDRTLDRTKHHPFATIVGDDEHDAASDLARPGVYRLNIGVGRETYRALFGPQPAWGKDGGPVETGHDFTRLDTFLPHPIYAPMSWICVLSPEACWPQAQTYLREAHSEAERGRQRTST